MAAVGSAVEMSYKYSLKGFSGHSGRHNGNECPFVRKKNLMPNAEFLAL